MPDVLREIAALDPERDAQRICLLSSAFHFPFDYHTSLQLALFRTFCVPSIAALLDATGEFVERPQKRYDDTVLLISEFVEHGLDSERGRRAIARMNAIHGRYRISNDDYLYVLSTFIFEPMRWIERFGWRPLAEKEKLAAFYLWRDIGQRMGIKDIPPTAAELEAFNLAYEAEHFRFNDASQRIGEATLGLFLSWFPRPLKPLVRQAVYALLDAPCRRSFGFPDPEPRLASVAVATLRGTAQLKRFLPKRRRPLFRTDLRYRSYPEGYEIERLGPP